MKSIKKLKTKIMKTLEKPKTKVMKKEVNLEKAMSDYLQESSKHYFQTKMVWYDKYKEDYYKVLPAFFDGKLHYVSIKISGDKVDVSINDTSWVTEKKHLGMIKNDIFRQNVSHKSIKPSLELKMKMKIIKNFIDESSDMETLKTEIKKILL